jgi:hypothetical protein
MVNATPSTVVNGNDSQRKENGYFDMPFSRKMSRWGPLTVFHGGNGHHRDFTDIDGICPRQAPVRQTLKTHAADQDGTAEPSLADEPSPIILACRGNWVNKSKRGCENTAN